MTWETREKNEKSTNPALDVRKSSEVTLAKTACLADVRHGIFDIPKPKKSKVPGGSYYIYTITGMGPTRDRRAILLGLLVEKLEIADFSLSNTPKNHIFS